jgi:hypothetical protein
MMSFSSSIRSALPRCALACALAAAAASWNVAAAGAGDAAGFDPARAGIPVYPGAKADADASAFLRESLNVAGSAFRTGDDATKVTAFYDRQNGMRRMPGASPEQALFSAGCKAEFDRFLKKDIHQCDYQVTVQNPWRDMKSGKLVKDTLITIVRQ